MGSVHLGSAHPSSAPRRRGVRFSAVRPMSRSVVVLIGWLLVLGLVGCGEGEAPSKGPSTTARDLEDLLGPAGATGDGGSLLESEFRLTTVTDTGIDFQHESGNSEERPFPAANGSGVGVLDFDLDGWPDLFFANGTTFPIDPENTSWRDALYRNLGGFRFANVSTASGVDSPGYSAGVAVGDFNDDGFPDLYVTCYGRNLLFCNQGDGTFVEMGALTGVDDPQWGTSAVFFDLNDDGLLDLYVGNYAVWDLESNKHCRGADPTERIFCSPLSVAPAPDALFLNRGDGTFEDITETSGVGQRLSRTQGVLAVDLTGNGWTDLYLGNDMHANSLFINRGDGTFSDQTDRSGMGFDSNGGAQAGMGVAAGDTNRDGQLEVFVTNYTGENNNLYRQVRPERYADVSASVGLAADSLPWVGWGTAFIDLNLNGWPDLVVTNGHTDHNKPNEPYAQPALLWKNLEGRFARVDGSCGTYFQQSHVGRGLAYADLDNQGGFDVIVAHLGGPPAVLRNETPQPGGWLLQLEGRRGNRDAIGARVVIQHPDGNLVQHVIGGGSYLSCNDARLWIPYSAGPVMATIHWGPQRSSQLQLDACPVNRHLIIREVHDRDDDSVEQPADPKQ